MSNDHELSVTKAKTLGEGESFGEVAFLRECTRTATIRVSNAGESVAAVTKRDEQGQPVAQAGGAGGGRGRRNEAAKEKPEEPVREAWFIAVPRSHYMTSMKRMHQRDLHDKQHFIHSLPLFSEINSAELNDLTLQIHYRVHYRDEIFAREGTSMDEFMVVKSGNVREAKFIELSEEEFVEKRHSKPADAVVEEELYGERTSSSSGVISPRKLLRADKTADPGGACKDTQLSSSGNRLVSILVSKKGPGDVLGWFSQSPTDRRGTSFIVDGPFAVIAYISAFNMNNLRHRFVGARQAKEFRARALAKQEAENNAAEEEDGSAAAAARAGPSIDTIKMQNKLKRVYKNQKAEKEWEAYKKKVINDLYREKQRKRAARREASFNY